MRGASGAPNAWASCSSVGKLVSFGHVPPAAGAARPLASPGLGSSASRPVSVTQAGGGQRHVRQLRARAGEGHPAAIDQQRRRAAHALERRQHLVARPAAEASGCRAGTGARRRAHHSPRRAGTGVRSVTSRWPSSRTWSAPRAKRVHSSWARAPRCHCHTPRRRTAPRTPAPPASGRGRGRSPSAPAAWRIAACRRHATLRHP